MKTVGNRNNNRADKNPIEKQGGGGLIQDVETFFFVLFCLLFCRHTESGQSGAQSIVYCIANERLRERLYS